eukprot:28437-Chlamydomonas_euryale.AAC.4
MIAKSIINQVSTALHGYLSHTRKRCTQRIYPLPLRRVLTPCPTPGRPYLHAARPAHICDRGRWRAPHARGAVHICGAAGGGVRARQRRHGVGQLLPQVKRVKVVHAEAHVAHAQLLAPRLDRLDVEVEVGHVGVLLWGAGGGELAASRLRKAMS